jgi:uncharacterized protein (DUF885 family)
MKTTTLCLLVLMAIAPACKRKAPTTDAGATLGAAPDAGAAPKKVTYKIRPPTPGALAIRTGPLAGLTQRYLDGLFRAKPHLATFMGDHRFDGALPDYSPEALRARGQELAKQAEELARIVQGRLALDDRIDAEVLRDGIELERLYLSEIRDWTWDPRLEDSFPYYDPREIVAGRLSDILHGEFAPVGARKGSVISQLKALPRMLAQIRSGFGRPNAIYLKQGISGNKGRIAFFEKDVAAFVKGDAAGEAALQDALKALREYQAFLENDLSKRADGDWRLGDARYRKKFPLALQTNLSPDDVLPRAQAAFTKARAELAATARKLHAELWPGVMPKGTDAAIIRKVKEELAKDHASAADLVKAHAANLDRMRAFIAEKNLLELPPKETLVVAEMPEFKRGAQAAEYLAPGILEKRDRWQATYYVDPIDPTWKPERVESYLRGQNNYSVELVAVHEAYPGHHVQFFYSQRNLNPLRATLWNAPMAEGWAVYGEEQMVKLGYGGPKNDRYRFFTLQGHMVVATNAIIDIKLHTGKMTDAEAVRFMVEEGFQERAMAEKKLVRAKLDSTQLTQYFLGWSEIHELEDDYRRKVGASFQQRAFNEAIIGHGTLAVKYLREYLLGS